MQTRSVEITIETSIAKHLDECDIPAECQLGSLKGKHFFGTLGENQQAHKYSDLGDTAQISVMAVSKKSSTGFLTKEKERSGGKDPLLG